MNDKLEVEALRRDLTETRARKDEAERRVGELRPEVEAQRRNYTAALGRGDADAAAKAKIAIGEVQAQLDIAEATLAGSDARIVELSQQLRTLAIQSLERELDERQAARDAAFVRLRKNPEAEGVIDDYVRAGLSVVALGCDLVSLDPQRKLYADAARSSVRNSLSAAVGARVAAQWLPLRGAKPQIERPWRPLLELARGTGAGA